MSKCDIILHAEDDENDAFFFCTALSKAGVDNPIVRVANGEEAFCYLMALGAYSDRTKYPFPCLLITDLSMPRLSGFDLLARAQVVLDAKNVPGIVLSASTAESDKEQARQLGAQAYFVKPPELNGLIAIANQIKHSWLERAVQPV
jgi:CheY-like chemotaxis protein